MAGNVSGRVIIVVDATGSCGKACRTEAFLMTLARLANFDTDINDAGGQKTDRRNCIGIPSEPRRNQNPALDR